MSKNEQIDDNVAPISPSEVQLITAYYSPVAQPAEEIVAQPVEELIPGVDPNVLREGVRKGIAELLGFIGISGDFDAVTVGGARYTYGLRAASRPELVKPTTISEQENEQEGVINE